MTSEIYSTEPRRGDVNIFHYAPTLRGIVVLVFTKQMDFVFVRVAPRSFDEFPLP